MLSVRSCHDSAEAVDVAYVPEPAHYLTAVRIVSDRGTTLDLLEGLLWVRYFAVPLLENSSVGSFAPGGIIGIAGEGLVVLGGYLGLAAWRRGPSPVAAVPSV